MLKGAAGTVCDRSRSVGKTVRQISRTLARRTGEAKQQVIELNSKAGAQIATSAREARKLAARAKRSARGRGAQAKLRAAAKLEQLAEHCEKIAKQISRRARGLKITDRLVSLSDPDARPIRKGQARQDDRVRLRRPDRRDHPEHAQGGTRVRAAGRDQAGQPDREHTAARHHHRALQARDPAARLVGDGGFVPGSTQDQIGRDTRLFLSGRHEPGSRRTRKRQARYRTGAEGRISHLKRGYGLRRSRLKGHDGQQTWTGWAILSYNLDTYHHYAT